MREALELNVNIVSPSTVQASSDIPRRASPPAMPSTVVRVRHAKSAGSRKAVGLWI